MKKITTRVVSFVVSLTMILASVPIAAYANGDDSNGLDSVTETQFVSGTGLNSIANNLNAANDSADYSITYVEVIDKKAYLKINNITECTLVVAIYDENTLQMLESNVSTIDANVSTTEIVIDIDNMPEKFLTKAFLLDENNAALCSEYVDNKNTTVYEEFLAKAPADFSGENIVYFSEDEDIVDFGVLNNSVEIQNNTSNMSFSYDESLKTYIFENSTNEIKNLSVGEVFYYPYGEKTNEFILFKVASISISGDTVTIKEDENIDLKDVFSFVRIDEEGDYSDVEIDETQLGEAFTLADDSGISTYSYDVDATASFEESLNVEWPKKSDDAYKSAHIEGQIAFALSTNVVLTYDPELFGEDYYEFKSETTFEFGLTDFKIVGEISLPDKYSTIPVAKIPIGPFTLTPSIKVILSFSASLGLSAVYKETITVTGDSDNGVKKHVEAEKEIDADSDAEVKIEIGAGAELKLSLLEVVSLSVSGQAGIVFKGKLEVTGNSETVMHPCYICIYGDVNFVVSFDVKLSVVILKDVVDYSVSFIDWHFEKKLGDLHISYSEDGLDCGTGRCERIMTRATISVLGMDYDTFTNYPIEGAMVTVPGGAFDADGDGEFSEAYCETDEEGKAYVFLRTGEHTVTVKTDTYLEKTAEIKMLYTPKMVNVVLSEGESGKCGDNLTWTFNKNTGVLTISGTGDMYDYEHLGENRTTSPWCQFGYEIDRIKIENGVTSIGDYAFKTGYGHVNQEVMEIPNSVKKIGKQAFWGWSFDSVNIPESVNDIGFAALENSKFVVDSNNKHYSSDSNGVLYNKDKTLVIRAPEDMPASYTIPSSVTDIEYEAYSYCDFQSLVIPSNVKTIGESAFSGSKLKSVIIKNGATAIGDYAFGYCDELESITIPESVTSIGEDAFSNCHKLKNVVLPDSITDIGEGAFINCYSLESIVIPYGVSEIKYRTFYSCGNLTEATIPTSVTSIGNEAFCNCDGLTSITIPHSVTNIGDDAFDGCNSLTSISVDKNNKYYSNDEYGALFNKNKTILMQYPIGNSRTSYNIPDSVTSICESAFGGCVSLTSLTIPAGVTAIVNYAFSYCTSLSSITIPDSVTSIGRWAFNYCYSLSDVYYTGTQTQWNNISIDEDGNSSLLNATIHYNYSLSSTNCAAVYSHANISNMAYENSTEAGTYFEGCVAGNKYILLNVYGYVNGIILTEENLYYIDCRTADSNGTVNISFTPKEENPFCTTVLIGDFGNGVEAKVIDSPMYVRTPSTTTISYGDSIVLHADMNEALPSGWKIKWTADNGNFDYNVSTDGSTCTITPSKSGDTTFSATVYDENGNEISKDTQTMKSKAGFFDKIIAFFKKLFGLTKVIQQSIDF